MGDGIRKKVSSRDHTFEEVRIEFSTIMTKVSQGHGVHKGIRTLR